MKYISGKDTEVGRDTEMFENKVSAEKQIMEARMLEFGDGKEKYAPKEAFGDKGSILIAMSSMGIPVPPGFVLNVSVCEDYFKNSRQLPEDLPSLLRKGILFLENITGKIFGGSPPLMVSIRSGAAASMPGSMETLLNVGLSRDAVRSLIARTGNPSFAWDSYRRLIEGFGRVVFSQDPTLYQSLLNSAIEAAGVLEERELDYMELRELAGDYERLFFGESRRSFPEDIYEQLELAVRAVLDSWMRPRAKEYRKVHNIKGIRGTAVTVQAMVFGNMSMNSGAGIYFTRNPWTGEKLSVVDFRFEAQGEDVVSGSRAGTLGIELKTSLPDIYKELEEIGDKLEFHFKDMQDIEFTVEEEKLYILQSRNGKRSSLAALKIAVDLEKEGLISPSEALEKLEGIDLNSISVQNIKTDKLPLAKGDSASLGIAIGKIAFSSEKAKSYAPDTEEAVILVRETPSPDDISGIHVSAGFLTARGARTAHAAVVARQLGKVCIVNCQELKLDPGGRKCSIGGKEFLEGDVISLDGASGKVYEGKVEVTFEKPIELLEIVDVWKRESPA
ncbi:MAG TPA: PEP/pyruvate-binding domain-containing protein [Methanosarcina sp.]